MQRGQQVVQLGKETTRGTAVTTTAAWAVEEDGFTAPVTNGLAEKRPNVTFPFPQIQVPVGTTWKPRIKVDLNRDNIRDIILMATSRASGVLNSFTILENQYGISSGVAQYVGCVLASLNISASRGGSPGPENIWTAELEFECMGKSNTGTLQSLTAAVASRFQLRHSTFLCNNVAQATMLLSLALQVQNALDVGPVGISAANVRDWIEDGAESIELDATMRFTTLAKQLLVEAGTEAATNTLVIATGTANETVTATIGKAQMETRNVATEGTVVTEQFKIKPYYNAGAPVTWAFGSSIGASALSLS